MDVDFWTSRVLSSKNLSAVQAASRNSGDEVLNAIDLDVSKLQKAYDELMAMRMQLSKRKTLKDEESKKRPVANTPHFHTLTDFALGYASTDNHLAMDDSDGDDNSRAYFPCPFCYVEIEVHLFCGHLLDEHCFDLKNAVCPLCAANLGKDAIGHFIVQHASSLKHRRKHKKSGLWTGSSAMLGKDLSSFLGSSTNNRANTHESAPDPLLSPFLGNLSLSDPRQSQHDEPSNISASHSKSSGMSSLDRGSQVDNEEQRKKSTFVQQLIASTIF
ncbi:hypothetical protein POTOM_042115 [Populus tomentosa]|uniref:Uncharacterized protein n=1 Tax=Populus tomentosa TaxID=118781 RepID=A0A8X7YQZ3_POPTO|nr:hypothetical protein POTOM_042115 [Populus tomentosa]